MPFTRVATNYNWWQIQNDKPNASAATIKEQLDKAFNQNATEINTLIGELEVGTGASFIGAGVGSVQAKLNDLQTQITTNTNYIYKGGFDASGGIYPELPSDFDYWTITVGGTLGGVSYVVGDELAYASAVWFKKNHLNAAVFEPWQNVTLLNGWINADMDGMFYTAQITKNGAGNVRIRGRISGAASQYIDMVLIPEGFRPSKSLIVFTSNFFEGAASPYAMQITAAGNINGLQHDVTSINLDGISYLLD